MYFSGRKATLSAAGKPPEGWGVRAAKRARASHGVALARPGRRGYRRPSSRHACPRPGPRPGLPAQLRHGVRAAPAVHRGDVRLDRDAAQGGAERRRGGRRGQGAARGHRAEAACCCRSSCWPARAWPRCWRAEHWLARMAGAVFYAWNPVRRRAADHRPVGIAARLRRPALGAARCGRCPRAARWRWAAA